MTNRKDWQTSVSVRVTNSNDARFSEMANAGIHFVEMTGGKVDDYADFRTSYKEMFKCAARNDIKIRSVHLPFSPFSGIDPAHLEKSARDEFVRIESELTLKAAEGGADIVVIHPSGEPYKEEERELRMQYAVDSLSQLQRVAKSAGILMAIENLPRTCLGRDCADMKKLGEALPDAFFCYDSNHALTDSNESIIRTMGSKIIAVHISDYDFINERHFMPGDGKNDWETIMRTLEEVGYSGTWNYELNDCESISAKAYKENHEKLLAGLIK